MREAFPNAFEDRLFFLFGFCILLSLSTPGGVYRSSFIHRFVTFVVALLYKERFTIQRANTIIVFSPNELTTW